MAAIVDQRQQTSSNERWIGGFGADLGDGVGMNSADDALE